MGNSQTIEGGNAVLSDSNVESKGLKTTESAKVSTESINDLDKFSDKSFQEKMKGPDTSGVKPLEIGEAKPGDAATPEQPGTTADTQTPEEEGGTTDGDAKKRTEAESKMVGGKGKIASEGGDAGAKKGTAGEAKKEGKEGAEGGEAKKEAGAPGTDAVPGTPGGNQLDENPDPDGVHKPRGGDAPTPREKVPAGLESNQEPEKIDKTKPKGNLEQSEPEEPKSKDKDPGETGAEGQTGPVETEQKNPPGGHKKPEGDGKAGEPGEPKGEGKPKGDGEPGEPCEPGEPGEPGEPKGDGEPGEPGESKPDVRVEEKPGSSDSSKKLEEVDAPPEPVAGGIDGGADLKDNESKEGVKAKEAKENIIKKDTERQRVERRPLSPGASDAAEGADAVEGTAGADAEDASVSKKDASKAAEGAGAREKKQDFSPGEQPAGGKTDQVPNDRTEKVSPNIFTDAATNMMSGSVTITHPRFKTR